MSIVSTENSLTQSEVSLVEHQDLFPDEDIYAELIKFDQEAAVFCGEMRAGVSQRDTDLLILVNRHLDQLASSPSPGHVQDQIRHFSDRIWQQIINCPVHKREKLLAEFRSLVLTGELDERWPDLTWLFAKCKFTIIQTDQKLNNHFHANQFGQLHGDLIGRGDRFEVSESEAETVQALNTFLNTTPEGQQVFDALIGNPNDLEDVSQEGELFMVQRHRLEKLALATHMPEAHRQKVIKAAIDHLKIVTAESLKYRPANRLAAIIAAVHDYYKYGFSSNGQTMVTELGLHELLSADGGTKLLKILFKQHLPDDLLNNGSLFTCLDKVIPQVIFAHGFNHFPDFMSRMQPVVVQKRYETTLPSDCESEQDLESWATFTIPDLQYKNLQVFFRVLFGSIYPVCLRSKSLPGLMKLPEKSSGRKFITEMAVVISGADKWIGAYFESFKKYHLDTPHQAITSSESLVLYFVTRILASFLNCIETDDVEELIQENRDEIIVLQAKVALVLGAIAKASPMTQYNYESTDQQDNEITKYKNYPKLLKWIDFFRVALSNTNASGCWTKMVDANKEHDLLTNIAVLKMSLNYNNQQKYQAAEELAWELQEIYLKYRTDTQLKNEFDETFLLLLTTIDSLDGQNILDVISLSNNLLEQLMTTLRALTGEAVQQAELKL